MTAAKVALTSPMASTQDIGRRIANNELQLDSYGQVLYEAYQNEPDPVLKQELYNELEAYLESNN